ncbi:ribosome biogenesis GTP-binding protein YihA/YsxC [Parasphingopyxis sp.]|uniref:ribosome biogenesis GTP-binding protein YihA/YsxC n=1 Tax=Parasphingopyxis sp. TaxID=1920299 RepID=UPI002610012F|nr:ribosome biogenesis GTP-binding protein YihA/YsxC [Parasphingopyxis sp.]
MTDQAAMEEMIRKTFSGPIDFLKSAPSLEFLPNADLPEVAFAGRSNVGKSTLLNALTNRKGLARASNTPGRTQELNFFEVGNPPQFRLVDMPGYGFAKAPPQVAKRWRHLINDFLRGRPTLKRTLLLIDARRGLKDIDRELMDMLDEAAVSYRIVLTKSDKLKDEALVDAAAKLTEQAKTHAAAHPDILTTSSETGLGVDELRKAVIQAIG